MSRRLISSAARISIIAIWLVLARQGSAYYCRIMDLTGGLVPPNPVTVSGRIVSTDPVQISDGSGTITVSGLTGDVTAYITVNGNWNGSVLAAAGTVPYSDPPSSGEQRGFLLPGGGMTTMVYVPAGSFQMGNSGTGDDLTAGNPDELPRHSVSLSGFWIGKYTVTRGEYRRFILAGGYSSAAYWSSDGWAYRTSQGLTQPDYWAPVQNWGTGNFTQTDSYPVIGITYYEAEAFCKWAGFRLPTEAEWEKAARWDGHARIYPWGDTWNVANCNNWDDPLYPGAQTAPVGSYPAGVSPFGVLDMAGNMWQWCSDWYSPTYYSSTPSSGWIDPAGPASGSQRVLRGCSYESHTTDNRSARREHYEPYFGWPGSGFRVAL